MRVKILWIVLCSSLTLSCKEETVKADKSANELLPGHWDSYEAGTEQSGFTAGVTTSLTLMYESGMAFSKDGKFRARYHNNGTWTESQSDIGTFELSNKTISLTFSPGTKDEKKLDLQLIKLDEKYLWFKHSYFVETEYHLKRDN